MMNVTAANPYAYSPDISEGSTSSLSDDTPGSQAPSPTASDAGSPSSSPSSGGGVIAGLLPGSSVSNGISLRDGPNSADRPHATGRTATTTPNGSTEAVQNPDALPGTQWKVWSNPPPLFSSSGPRETDVVQGGVGDCFLNASMAELAREDPQWIQNHILTVPNPDDPANPTYQVTLFDDQGQQRIINVDSKLLLQSNDTPLAEHGSQALWPAIYEKAYAIMISQTRGISFDQALNDGGDMPGAFINLTGGPRGSERNLSDLSPNDFATAVNSKLVGLSNANVNQPDLINNRYTTRTNGNVVHVDDPQTGHGWDFHANHQYSIDGIETEPPGQDPAQVDDDHLLVYLYNPWGADQSNQQGLAKPVPLSVLKSVYGEVDISDLPKEVG